MARTDITGIVDTIAARAVASGGVSVRTAAEAATSTIRALRHASGSPAFIERRATNYFGAVVRRKALRDAGSAPIVSRLVVEAIISDLLESGRSAEEVWCELERGWRHAVPGEVLEEYRDRLCA